CRQAAAWVVRCGVVRGGEESGGFGFGDPLRGRDGLVSALLVLEAVVASGATLDDLLRTLEAEAGAAAYRRRDYTLHPDLGRRLVTRLAAEPPEALGSWRGVPTEALDGRKESLDGGDRGSAWVRVCAAGAAARRAV